MSEPIKIIVTAETAQAAAALQAFVAQTGAGLKSLVPAAAAGASSLTQAREAAMLTHESFRTLSSTAFLLGGTRFPELSMGVMSATQGLRALRTAALLTGLGMSELLIPIAAIGAVLAAGAFVWHQFSSGEAEAAKATKDLEESLGKIPALLEKINTLRKAGMIGAGAGGEFSDFLTGKKKLYKDSQGNLTPNPTEQVEEFRTIPPVAPYGQPMQMPTGNMIPKNLSEASMAEAQAWVEKQLSGEAGLNDTRVVAIAKLKELEEKARTESLAGLEKEKAAIHDKYEAQRVEIAATITAAGPLMSAEKKSAADFASAQLDIAEGNAIITAEKKAQAKSDEETLEIQNLFEKGLREEEALEKSIDDQITKQRQETEKMLALKQGIARSASEAQLKAIQGNPLLTNQQKAQQSIQPTQDMMAANTTEIAGLQSQYNGTTDLTAQLEIRKKINDLMVQQSELQNKLNADAGQSSFATQFKEAVVNLQNMNNLAKECAQTFTGVLNTAVNSIAQNLTKIIEGTETWREALLNIGETIVNSIIEGIIQMGVRWVLTQTMMAVLGETLSASAVGVAAGEAASLDAIWWTPAVLSTVATAGVTAVDAPGLVAAAMIGFAAGGRPMVGGLSLVGERGPELFVPDTAGTIIPAHQTAALLRGGSGAPASGPAGLPGKTNVTNAIFFDTRLMADSLEKDSAHEQYVVDVMRRNIHRFR
jgi:hypothetical protein